MKWPATYFAIAHAALATFGIVLREPARNMPVQAVNGHCLKCDYRLAWIVIRGRRGSAPALNSDLSLSDGAN